MVTSRGGQPVAASPTRRPACVAASLWRPACSRQLGQPVAASLCGGQPVAASRRGGEDVGDVYGLGVCAATVGDFTVDNLTGNRNGKAALRDLPTPPPGARGGGGVTTRSTKLRVS